MEGPTRTIRWEELVSRVGTEIGTSPWVRIDQRMIDIFADVTGDHYFIHVDPARAAALPFRGTIAHGFLTLSLLSMMAYQACPRIEGTRYPLNYGFNRLRFVSPVPTGSNVRGRFSLRSAQVIDADQRQVVYDATIEIEGASRPAIVAEWLTRAIL